MPNNNERDIWYSSYSDMTPDEQEAFKKALFLSKGKSNNKLAALLILTGASAEVAAEYASRAGSRGYLHIRNNKRLTETERAIRQVERSVPNYWDTIKGKRVKERFGETLKKMGVDTTIELPISRLDKALASMYLVRTYSVGRLPYVWYQSQDNIQYNADAVRTILFASVYSPLLEVKFDGDVKGLLGCAKSNERAKMPDYDKYRDYDIDSFSNMDEEVTKGIKPDELCVDTVNSALGCRFKYRASEPKTIELQCVVEGFYEVCKEIGIAGMMNANLPGRRYVSESAMKGIMQNVIKMGGMYRRLVKGGFAESVARETVVAEINENIEKRASRPILRFYPRNDYVDTPEEEREVAKKVSSTSSGGGRKMLTLDELWGASDGDGEVVND